MSYSIHPLGVDRLPRLRPIFEDPALAEEFDVMLPPGQLEHKLNDHLGARDATFLALDGERPAGFAISFALPGVAGRHRGAVRVAVATRDRRRGLGTALLERAVAAFAARERDRPATIEVAAWQPSPAADGFAARHGFGHARWFWRMSRAPHPVPEVAWPEGVTVKLFDGSEGMLRDWTAAYNESFAEHWGFIPGRVEDSRVIAADPLFLKDGVIVAYRDGRIAGFCRNEAVGTSGVVGVLGTSPHARGIGLGRALLRWAIGALAAAGFDKVSLLVDGENDTAQRLYRSEGFAVERTRRIWNRPLSAFVTAAR